MTDLKPCPFCGGKAEMYFLGNEKYTVRCKKCPAALVFDYDTVGLASACWNTRPRRKRKEE